VSNLDPSWSEKRVCGSHARNGLDTKHVIDGVDEFGGGGDPIKD
jgi:hypothetical protein